MVIDKGARHQMGYLRPFRSYPNCRLAFREFLQRVGISNGEKVLLPAYIGWSAREGSGVFDPIRELGLSYDFYRVDDRLRIELADFRRALSAGRTRVVVLIHYFGAVDPGYVEAVALAREFGALVLEDEAHALLTDLVGGACGRLADACVFSLHKLLPVATGGMLVINPGRGGLPGGWELTPADTVLWQYDLHAIALRRRENLLRIEKLLQPLGDELEPLWKDWPTDNIPQTFPVLLRRNIRDQLYFDLNACGYGVVSLYHTLIEEITPARFPEAHRVSQRILNLPVHQDVEPYQLDGMISELRNRLQGDLLVSLAE